MKQDDGSPKERPGASSKSVRSGSGDRDMGSALRAAYQKTVDETVPDEMLDLLGKLA